MCFVCAVFVWLISIILCEQYEWSSFEVWADLKKRKHENSSSIHSVGGGCWIDWLIRYQTGVVQNIDTQLFKKNEI